MGPVLQLLRGLFSVIPGRHAESFFESAVKVRQILVADFLCDGKNRGFGGDQQAVSPVMDVKGKYIQLAYPVEQLKKLTYGKGKELAENYDKVMQVQYDFSGAMVRRYSLRYSMKEVPIVFLKYFMKCDWLSPTSAETSAIVMRSI